MADERKIVDQIIVERNKKRDDAILAGITEIGRENGLDTIITLNEKAIVKFLKKQIPKKIRVDDEGWLYCPNCEETFHLNNQFHKRNNYCGACGQKLDWSNQVVKTEF